MPTLSIDLTTEQANRISEAVGKLLSLGRPATPAEARTWLISRIKDAVLAQEKKNAEEAIALIQPIDIS
jgi:hypothetical protein